MVKLVSNKIAYSIIVSVVCLLALLFFYLAECPGSDVVPVVEFIETSDEPVEQSYFSVMIDNFYETRPQAGLSAAAVVYEALVEGGATRFLAVFSQANVPEKIGPIRSARLYFLDWANQYGGIFLHAGGSPQALASLDTQNYQFGDVDEISYQGIYFYRDSQGVSPHNLFTNPDLISQAVAEYAMVIDWAPGWNVKTELPLEARTTELRTLVIPYPVDSYRVTWVYDRASNNWQRWTNGQFDSIEAKNVVILSVATRLIDAERLGMDTVGRGTAWLFRDGQKQEIIWQKDSLTAPLELRAGEQWAQLNEGNVWFEVLPAYLDFEYN